MLIAIALVALLGGIAFSSGLYPRLFQSGGRTVTPNPTSRSTVRSSNPTVHPSVAATTQPGAKSTTVPSQSSPSTSATYPTLASVYTGTISDKFTSPPTNSPMTLSQMRQNGANVRGYLTLSSLQGNGPLTGTLSTNKGIQFTVPGLYGHLPLLFKGSVASNGNMSGTYCSSPGNNQCDLKAGGYGDWKVSSSSGQS